jgi:hypothetical protein
VTARGACREDRLRSRNDPLLAVLLAAEDAIDLRAPDPVVAAGESDRLQPVEPDPPLNRALAHAKQLGDSAGGEEFGVIGRHDGDHGKSDPLPNVPSMLVLGLLRILRVFA